MYVHVFLWQHISIVAFQGLSSHMWAVATILDSTHLKIHWRKPVFVVVGETGVREVGCLLLWFSTLKCTEKPHTEVGIMLYSLGCISVLSEIIQFASLEPISCKCSHVSELQPNDWFHLLTERVSQLSLEKSHLCLPGLVTHWFLLSITDVCNGTWLYNNCSYTKPFKNQSKQ